jgi:3-keto-disaccharide hydrolase/uncharacterized protein DUF1579
MRNLSPAALLLLPFLLLSSLYAQDGAGESGDAMMKNFMEAMTPGEQHAALKQGVGKFLVETKISMPGSPTSVSWGRAQAKMTLGGRFLEVDWQDTMMGMPTAGRVVIGYDKTRKQWESISYSTLGTGTMIGWGTEQEDGSVVYKGINYEFPTPEGRPFKHTHRWLDADTQYMEAFDWIEGKWIRVVEQTWHRRRALFDGQSLAGWDRVPLKEGEDMSKTWAVVDGILICRGTPGGYIRTTEAFENYELNLEWRWAPGSKGGNSGLLVHTSEPNALWGWPKCLEVQLQANNAGDFWEIKETVEVDDMEKRRRGRNIKRVAAENPERAPGYWNRMKVQCRGDAVTVWVNGVQVNAGRKCSASKGKICLQSEGAPIHFRTVNIVPLPAAK